MSLDFPIEPGPSSFHRFFFRILWFDGLTGRRRRQLGPILLPEVEQVLGGSQELGLLISLHSLPFSV